MEAKHATDCAPWKESIDPDAARSIAGAIDDLAEFPVLDATVLRVIALCDDQDSTAADLVDALEQDATFAANLLRCKGHGVISLFRSFMTHLEREVN